MALDCPRILLAGDLQLLRARLKEEMTEGGRRACQSAGFRLRSLQQEDARRTNPRSWFALERCPKENRGTQGTSCTGVPRPDSR